MASSGYIEQLAVELRARLEQLDRERRAINDALRALEPPASASRPTARRLEVTVIERLERSPGSRASLLALELSVETARVVAVLEQLQSRGRVRPAGLGWQVVDG